MKRSKVITQVLIFIGILVVVNMISENMFLRLDFTADKRYTLSNATKDILEDLDDVITVTAYFTKDLPPQLQKSRKDFEDEIRICILCIKEDGPENAEKLAQSYGL